MDDGCFCNDKNVDGWGFCGYINVMLTWDDAKRAKTLTERGINFADADQVFAGPNDTWIDDRFAYGEQRYITAGWLNGRFVIVVWTPRDDGRRIISMRYGHDKERKRCEALGRSR